MLITRQQWRVNEETCDLSFSVDCCVLVCREKRTAYDGKFRAFSARFENGNDADYLAYII